MVKRLAKIAAAVLLLGGLAAGTLWVLWPNIMARVEWWKAMGCIDDHPANRLRSAAEVSPARYSVDTFTHNIESSDIAEYYDEACGQMAQRYGAASLRTYRWCDEMGYEGVSTVYQGEGGYVAVTAFSGNDSDTAKVQIEKGAFQRPNQRLLTSRALPAGLLRYTWQDRETEAKSLGGGAEDHKDKLAR